MIIRQKEEGKDGAFYIEEGELLAEMTYRKEGQTMIIDHTEVDESLRGKNVGYQLVENGVEYARAAHLKILPICEFARSVIERTPAFHDVL